MNKESLSLSNKFDEHLLKTVGKRPNKSEIDRVDRKIRKSFDKIYDSPNKNPLFLKKEYDKNISKVWGRAVAHESVVSEVNLFKKYSNIKDKSNLVSLASGICVFELFIAKEFIKNGKVCCIDISQGMSNQSRKYIKKLKLDNVKIVVNDIIKLPVRTNSQNIVLARRTGLSNDDKWINILEESCRILRKEEDSRFIYTVDHDFTKPLKEIKRNLRCAGLKFITQDNFIKGDGERVDMIVAKPLP